MAAAFLLCFRGCCECHATLHDGASNDHFSCKRANKFIVLSSHNHLALLPACNQSAPCRPKQVYFCMQRLSEAHQSLPQVYEQCTWPCNHALVHTISELVVSAQIEVFLQPQQLSLCHASCRCLQVVAGVNPCSSGPIRLVRVASRGPQNCPLRLLPLA